MLKAYFDIFNATEEQLTTKAIGRLKFASFLGLFLMPMVILIDVSGVSGALLNVMMIFTLFTLVGFGYAAMSRAGNRLWVPNKYLDESEIRTKHISAYKTYKWLMLSIFGGVISFVVLEKAFGLSLVNLNVNDVLYYILGYFLMTAICLQTFFAASLMQPLEIDEVSGQLARNATDKWYKIVACVFVFVFLILPFIIGPFTEGFKQGYSG